MNLHKKLSARQKARRRAMQGLYAWQLSHNELSNIEMDVLGANLNEKLDLTYFRVLLHEIPKNLTFLEEILSPFLSMRAVHELDPIELTILRMAVYELKFQLDIPYKVVINEALELAKTFGSIEGYKFVNGVLDKVAKVLRPLS